MNNYFLKWGVRNAAKFLKTAEKRQHGIASPRELSLLGILQKQSGKQLKDLYKMAIDRTRIGGKGSLVEKMPLSEWSDVGYKKLKIMNRALSRMKNA